MRMDRYLPPEHWLSKIYRVGAAILGVGLIVFGALGLAYRLAFLTTSGTEIMGLSTNGLLAMISIVGGAVLVAAAVWGGPLASTTTATIGVLFLLSGLVNLAVLETAWNLLAFELQNVVFSLVTGMLLLFLGLYGRVSGGLPDDNPYVRYRHHEPPVDEVPAQRPAERERAARLQPLVDAEIAFSEGHPTPQQERLVRTEAWRHAQAERQRAYEHLAHVEADQGTAPSSGTDEPRSQQDAAGDR